MEINIQYVSDRKGKPKAVQIPISEWEKVVVQLKKSEQILKLQSDLKSAFKEVEKLRKSTAPKQTLSEFLNEL